MKNNKSTAPAQGSTAEQNSNTILTVSEIILKPSQALCLSVLKKNIGKYVSTYVFRANGVSHPAGRIQELTEKGISIDRFYGPAFDVHGIEHTRAGWYRLVGGE